MISVEEAKSLIATNTIVLTSENVSVEKALSRVLSEDVYSEINLPPFNQSAMDGYAVCFGVDSQIDYKLKDLIKAGDNKKLKLKQGEAVRVYTGSPIPTNTTSVVMQERVFIKGNTISFTETTKGENIRIIGEQIKKGQLALKKDSVLNPAAIGFLSGLGIGRVNVFKRPKICVITTGNELIKPGETLIFGQIYESNSYTLNAAIQSAGFTCKLLRVKDELKATLRIIKSAIKANDVVVISGGISVGDYDFVGKALEILKVKQFFYKIKQKPGKPMFYGKSDSTSVFALPGNPASSLLCFYEYVLPALKKMEGKLFTPLLISYLPISSDYSKKGDFSHFLKAKIEKNQITLLEGQSSSIIKSFAEANCLVYINSKNTNVKKGDLVEVHLLP